MPLLPLIQETLRGEFISKGFQSPIITPYPIGIAEIQVPQPRSTWRRAGFLSLYGEYGGAIAPPVRLQAESYSVVTGSGFTSRTDGTTTYIQIRPAFQNGSFTYQASTGAGLHTVTARIASGISKAFYLALYANGTFLGNLPFASTGAFGSFTTTASILVSLPGGQQSLQVVFPVAEFDFDWIEFSPAAAPLGSGIMALLSTAAIGINAPQVLPLSPLNGASALYFGFAPVDWLPIYTISLQGFKP